MNTDQAKESLDLHRWKSVPHQWLEFLRITLNRRLYPFVSPGRGLPGRGKIDGQNALLGFPWDRE
jgi:hypothetical protein